MCGNLFLSHLQATDFLFQLFAAAVVCWADHRMPLLLGIRTQWFPWQPEPTPPLLTHSLYGVDVQADQALQQCLLGVCYSLPVLLDKEPWSSQTPKVGLTAPPPVRGDGGADLSFAS